MLDVTALQNTCDHPVTLWMLSEDDDTRYSHQACVCCGAIIGLGFDALLWAMHTIILVSRRNTDRCEAVLSRMRCTDGVYRPFEDACRWMDRVWGAEESYRDRMTYGGLLP